MENFFYVAIAIAYLVYYVVRAKKAKEANQSRPPANVPPPVPRAPQTLSEQQAEQRNSESRQREQAQQRNRDTQSHQRNAPPTDNTDNTRRSKSAFDILREELEGRNPRQQPRQPEPMERDPFLEEESPRTRRQAPKPVVRRDNHFSEVELVEEYKRQHAQGKQLTHHTHDYFDPKKDGLKGKMQIARKKKHPINKLLKGKENLRNAILLKEIIERKF
jgi:hypothetical protein